MKNLMVGIKGHVLISLSRKTMIAKILVVEWWSANCKDLLELIAECCKKLPKTKDNETFEEYKGVKREGKEAISKVGEKP